MLTFSCYSFTEIIENGSEIKDMTSHAYLTVKEIQNDDSFITLNDGSKWIIKRSEGIWKLLDGFFYDTKEISHWEAGDSVEIQTCNWLTILYNYTKKEYVYVVFNQIPSEDYPECLWIIKIDSDMITLNNGTMWLINNKDTIEGEIGDLISLINVTGSNTDFALLNHTSHNIYDGTRYE
jgi:hypothetical protein